MQNQNLLSFSSDLTHFEGCARAEVRHVDQSFRAAFPSGANTLGQIVFPSVFLRGTPSAYVARAPGSILESDWRFNTIGFYVQDDWRVKTVTLNLGMRYEFLTDPSELNGHISSVRDIRVDANPTCADARTACRPMIRSSCSKTLAPQFQPRAASPGMCAAMARLPCEAGPQSVRRRHVRTGIIGINWPLRRRAARAATSSSRSCSPRSGGRSAGGVDFHIDQPHSVQANLSVERELPWNIAATVAPRHARHQPARLPRRIQRFQRARHRSMHAGTACASTRERRLRSIPRATSAGSATSRVSIATGPIRFSWASDSNSWYHGLQLQVRKRLSDGIQFQSRIRCRRPRMKRRGSRMPRTRPPASADPSVRDRGPSA